jgi:transposase InsO family protein
VDETKKTKTEQVALFRYGVIADMVHLPPGTRGLYRMLEEKAAKSWPIPFSMRSRVAEETIRGWLRNWRAGGFEALKPKVRKDAGDSRALPQDVKDLLVLVKEESPELSVQLCIKEALARGKVPEGLQLAPTTVHRVLSRAGLMKKPGEAPGEADRHRFAFQRAGELWMSDVMHGPAVTVTGRQRRKTYLIGFLDDATRVVPYAAFALKENVAAFLPVLKGAVMRRGVPKRLFVDNGAAYRSQHLALVCAKLGITLIHARPYDAAAKGKQERWFRTVRMQLLPLLNDADTSSLDALNRRLWAWVESEYHQSSHRGLDGETPLDRWAKCGDEVKYLAAHDELDELCLAEARRKVAKDRTVSLNGLVYEVDASLVGATVVLRFEPTAQAKGVQVWHEGKKVQDAKVVDVFANCFVKRNRANNALVPSAGPLAPPPGLKLSALRDGKEG